MTTTATNLENGRVVAIAGPVVDAEFPPHALPEINHAVEMDLELDGNKITVTGEVAQQIGEGRVRCVCMQPTDGLLRGAVVRQTEADFAMVECFDPAANTCGLSAHCRLKGVLHQATEQYLAVLDGTTLADLIAPLQSPGKVVVSGPRSRKPALLPGIPAQRA